MAITVWSTFSILLQPLAQACEEPINLCESDDDALPQQPVHQRAPEFVVQMDARKLGAKKRKAEPGQQSHHSAAAGSEARRKDAALPAKQAQRAESRQLGIRDPLPPQLSSSNALLKSLAQGANRVSHPSSHHVVMAPAYGFDTCIQDILSTGCLCLCHMNCYRYSGSGHADHLCSHLYRQSRPASKTVTGCLGAKAPTSPTPPVLWT